MTPIAYRECLDRLGLSQVGAAKLFRVNERTARRWALGEQDVPRAVDITLTLMVRFKVKPARFMEWQNRGRAA